MSDVNFGGAGLILFAIIGSFFLVGFLVVLIPAWLFIYKYREKYKNIRWSIFWLIVLLLSTIIGVILVLLCLSWIKTDEQKQIYQREVFYEKMASMYKITSVLPDKQNGMIRINYEVPQAGHYSIDVYGFPSGELSYNYSDNVFSDSFRERVIPKGSNSLDLYINKDFFIQNQNPSIDLVFSIQPKSEQREVLTNRDMIFFSSGTGLIEGSGYYSQEIPSSVGCQYAGFNDPDYYSIPCTKSNLLHVKF